MDAFCYFKSKLDFDHLQILQQNPTTILQNSPHGSVWGRSPYQIFQFSNISNILLIISTCSYYKKKNKKRSLKFVMLWPMYMGKIWFCLEQMLVFLACGRQKETGKVPEERKGEWLVYPLTRRRWRHPCFSCFVILGMQLRHVTPPFTVLFHIRRKPLLVMGGQGFSTSAHGFRTEFQTLYQSKWKLLFK